MIALTGSIALRPTAMPRRPAAPAPTVPRIVTPAALDFHRRRGEVLRREAQKEAIRYLARAAHRLFLRRDIATG